MDAETRLHEPAGSGRSVSDTTRAIKEQQQQPETQEEEKQQDVGKWREQRCNSLPQGSTEEYWTDLGPGDLHVWVTLRLESINPRAVKALVAFVWLAILASTLLFVLSCWIRLAESTYVVFTRSVVPIGSVVLTGLTLLMEAVTGGMALKGLAQARARKLRWSSRRWTLLKWSFAEHCLVMGSTGCMLAQNVIYLAVPCSWFSIPATLLSFFRTSCVYSSNIVAFVDIHNFMPLRKEGDQPQPWLARPWGWLPGMWLRRRRSGVHAWQQRLSQSRAGLGEGGTMVMDLPSWFHLPKMLLWLGNTTFLILMVVKTYNNSVRRFPALVQQIESQGLPCADALRDLDSSSSCTRTESMNEYEALTISYLFFTAASMAWFVALGIVVYRTMSQVPYCQFQLVRVAVLLQVQLRAVSFLLQFAIIISIVVLEMVACDKYLVTWVFGSWGLELTLAATRLVYIYLYSPAIIEQGDLSKIKHFRSEVIAWSEAEHSTLLDPPPSASAAAEAVIGTAACGEGGRAIAIDIGGGDKTGCPVFCMETAIKLAYWSSLVYEYDPARPGLLHKSMRHLLRHKLAHKNTGARSSVTTTSAAAIAGGAPSSLGSSTLRHHGSTFPAPMQPHQTRNQHSMASGISDGWDASLAASTSRASSAAGCTSPSTAAAANTAKPARRRGPWLVGRLRGSFSAAAAKARRLPCPPSTATTATDGGRGDVAAATWLPPSASSAASTATGDWQVGEQLMATASASAAEEGRVPGKAPLSLKDKKQKKKGEKKKTKDEKKKRKDERKKKKKGKGKRKAPGGWAAYQYDLGVAMSLYGLERYELLHAQSTDTRAILAWGGHVAVVAFMGTQTLSNIWTDLQVKLAAVHPDRVPDTLRSLVSPAVHSGFLRGWRAGDLHGKVVTAITRLREQEPHLVVYCTGHSLGGALATLAAFDLALLDNPGSSGGGGDSDGIIDGGSHCGAGPAAAAAAAGRRRLFCYTFGSPRTGNHPWCRWYDSLVPDSWRLVNRDDVVARRGKLLWLYKHAGNKVLLTSAGDLIVKPNDLEMQVLNTPGKASVHDHMLTKYQAAIARVLHTQLGPRGLPGGKDGVRRMAAGPPPMADILKGVYGVGPHLLDGVGPRPITGDAGGGGGDRPGEVLKPRASSSVGGTGDRPGEAAEQQGGATSSSNRIAGIPAAPPAETEAAATGQLPQRHESEGFGSGGPMLALAASEAAAGSGSGGTDPLSRVLRCAGAAGAAVSSAVTARGSGSNSSLTGSQQASEEDVEEEEEAAQEDKVADAV